MFLSFVVVASIFGLVASKFRSINVHEVKFNDLLKQDKSTSLLTSHVLSTVGILKIVDIPEFEAAQEEAFSGLADCLKMNQFSDTNIFRETLPDGSLRLSIGARTRGGVREEVQGVCAHESNLDNLRSLVDIAARQLFLSLDQVHSLTSFSSSPSSQTSKSDDFVMKPYSSFKELVDNGEHLEHFHTYFNTKSPELAQQGVPSMETHIDVGLLIAMTAGHFPIPVESLVQNSFENGLHMRLPSGETVHVRAQPGEVIIMVGQGAQWLSPREDGGNSLKPVPHSLFIDLGENKDATRSWYGKMFLPPANAELFETKMTFDEFRKKSVSQIKSPSLYENSDSRRILHVACGSHEVGYGLSTSESCDASGEPGIMCWTKCMSVADLSCGQNAVCADPDGTVTDSSVHCTTCAPICPAVSNSTSNGFCSGMGTSMSMTGFVGTGSDTECFVFLFPSWVLDSKVKFVFACIGTFLAGVLIHLLTHYKTVLKRKCHWMLPETKFWLICLLYAFQITLSYLIMLLAMTYNFELFAMVCLGLTFGFAFVNYKDYIEVIRKARAIPLSKQEYGIEEESIEPCCAVGDDDNVNQ